MVLTPVIVRENSADENTYHSTHSLLLKGPQGPYTTTLRPSSVI